MKVFLLVVLFYGSIAFASVEVRDGKVTANINSEPLRQVLESIGRQTDIDFSVEEDVASKTISANFQDLPIAAAIKKMLEGTGINYAVIGGADGKPQAVFLGNSEKPGSPPKKLDTRPMGAPNRGVVTPVAPLPTPFEQPRDMSKPMPPGLQKKQSEPSVNIPTGGGFAPQNPQQLPTKSPQYQPNNEDQVDEEEFVEEEEE